MSSDGHQEANVLSRRMLLRGATGVGLSAVAAAWLPGCGSGDEEHSDIGAAPEDPPETTTIRFGKSVISCYAAQALASEFLREEGFTDVQYLDVGLKESFQRLAEGVIDMHMYPAQLAAVRVDAGDPIVMLSGVQVGCYQVFANDAIKSLSDLKGRTVATGGRDAPDTVLLGVTLANVGIDIRTDVRVVAKRSPAEFPQALVSGEVDAVMVLPPWTYELRASGIGHVVLDSMMDRPWSQYFCCMATVNSRFLVKNPVASKRALRALLKSADVVAKDSERGVRAMVDVGFITDDQYGVTLEDLRMMPYDVWRRYDPADTLRFFGLRLTEAGLITGTPEEIISRGTDFRFLDELKRELKGS